MRYLVLEDNRSKICTAKTLRDWINHTEGGIRIFRLCRLNQPVELFLRWFGNGYLICDRFGNNEGV